MSEVKTVGNALPDDVAGVALREVSTVDAEEDVGGVAQAAHESDAQFVGASDGEVEVLVLLTDDFSLCRVGDESVWRPIFGDGGQEAVGVSVVVPARVVILRCPDDDALAMGQRLVVVVGVGGHDAKETEVVVGRGKGLTADECEGRSRLTVISFRGKEDCTENEEKDCDD